MAGLRRLRGPIFVLALLVALLLLGCGHTPVSGRVVGKQYTPAHSDTSLRCVAYSAKRWCTAWVPVTYFYRDEWELLIRDSEGDNWVDVDPDTYAHKGIGDTWKA